MPETGYRMHRSLLTLANLSGTNAAETKKYCFALIDNQGFLNCYKEDTLFSLNRSVAAGCV